MRRRLLRISGLVSSLLTGVVVLRRLREGRPYRYAPAATREAYAAELMLEALGRASDRHAALVRFVDAVSPKEAEVLRRALLGDAERREAPP